MSGGSHNYICYSIENELCGKMHDAELNDLMSDIVELTHDLEWYDSADYGEKRYRDCVEKFKAKWFKGDRTERLKGYIDKAIEDVRKDLYNLI